MGHCSLRGFFGQHHVREHPCDKPSRSVQLCYFPDLCFWCCLNLWTHAGTQGSGRASRIEGFGRGRLTQDLLVRGGFQLEVAVNGP